MLYPLVVFIALLYVPVSNGAMAARLDRVGQTALLPETLLLTLSLVLPTFCIFCLQTVDAQGQGKVEDISSSYIWLLARSWLLYRDGL